jgi:hypothetical protein
VNKITSQIKVRGEGGLGSSITLPVLSSPKVPGQKRDEVRESFVVDMQTKFNFITRCKNMFNNINALISSTQNFIKTDTSK